MKKKSKDSSNKSGAISKTASEFSDDLDKGKKPKILSAIIERYFRDEIAKVKPDPDFPEYAQAKLFRIGQMREDLIDLIDENPDVERLFTQIEKSQSSDDVKLIVVESVLTISQSIDTKDHFERALKIAVSCANLDETVDYLKQMKSFTAYLTDLTFVKFLDGIERKIKGKK